MKLIIVGTDRQGSTSKKVADYVHGLYQQRGEVIQMIDLAEINLMKELAGPHYGKSAPDSIQKTLDLFSKADGVIIVTPEYNGSVPGALKYFIDHLKYPEAFEYRPMCFVGLGGMFGGLRPVEHLQQIFGFRNSFIFPIRVFLMNVYKMWTPDGPSDPVIKKLLEQQTDGFIKFCEALKSNGLDANSLAKVKLQPIL